MSELASKDGAWREIASSGGVPTAVAYPMLALCTGIAGDFWATRSPLLLTVVLLLALISAAREVVGHRLLAAPLETVREWHGRYAVTVLCQALVWSIFACVTIYLNGRSWTGLVALLVTAGLVAGSTASLTPSFPLMSGYIVVVCLPTSAAYMLHGTRAEVMVGMTVATYCYFMVAVGKRNWRRSNRLRQTLCDLDQARSEAQQLAAELRALSAGQLQQMEKERLHLSREVHDDLGQLLTALKISLARLERQLEDEPAAEKLQPMKELLDAAMVSVRNIAGSLRPPLLDELGLAPALAKYVEEACERASLECRLRIPSSLPPLSKDLSLAAFRVCQEALTNALRHAQASRVEVELRVDGNTMTVVVADNGRGIEKGKQESSMGLLGIRERVRLLQGSVDIADAQGGGTRLQASFPLR